MNKKTNTRIVRAIIALWVAGVIIRWSYDGWEELWLTADGKQIPATLIVHGLKPGAFVYDYTITGVHYNGGCTPGDNARLGDQILVFVSASHPSFSSFKIPNFSLWTTLIPIALLLWLEFYLLKTLIMQPANSSTAKMVRT